MDDSAPQGEDTEANPLEADPAIRIDPSSPHATPLSPAADPPTPAANPPIPAVNPLSPARAPSIRQVHQRVMMMM